MIRAHYWLGACVKILYLEYSYSRFEMNLIALAIILIVYNIHWHRTSQQGRASTKALNALVLRNIYKIE